MHIRIVTFALGVPAEDFTRLATEIAPAFVSWPGLLDAPTAITAANVSVARLDRHHLLTSSSGG